MECPPRRDDDRRSADKRRSLERGNDRVPDRRLERRSPDRRRSPVSAFRSYR